MTKPRLEWREAARADLLAIVDYISEDNRDAAEALLDDIEAKVAQLVDHPKLYYRLCRRRAGGNGYSRIARRADMAALKTFARA